MGRLAALYPRAWQERYGAELADLLAERPPTARDRFDLLRGVADAWIHPQLVRPEAGVADTDVGRSRPWASAAAIVGGVLLIVAGAGMYATRVDPDLQYKIVDAPILALIGGMSLAAIAAITRSLRSARGSSGATAAGVAMLVGALVTAAPWPFLIVGLFGFVAASVGYGAIVAFRSGQPAGALIALGSMLLASVNTEDARALLSIPLALAWILVGVLDLRAAPEPTSDRLRFGGPAVP